MIKRRKNEPTPCVYTEVHFSQVEHYENEHYEKLLDLYELEKIDSEPLIDTDIDNAHIWI